MDLASSRAMPVPRLLLPTIITSTLLTACADEPVDEAIFPGRVPCASDGSWDGGLPTHRTFTYDEDKHLLSSQALAPDGTVIATLTNTWQDGHLTVHEIAGASRITYTWDGDQVAAVESEDLVPTDGDDGYTQTNRYAGGVQVEQRVTFHDPTRGASLTTITGDGTPRSTWRTCPDPADGRPCAVWVWEQPDRDPDHWTRATLDSNEDGAIDAEFTQSYDRHFLPLVNDWIILTGSAPLLQQRETHARELDGTETQYTIDIRSGTQVYVETFAFECAAARLPAAPGATVEAMAWPASPLPLSRRHTVGR